MSIAERRIVIEHEDGMRQIVGTWPAERAVPAILNVQDEEDRPRIVRLVQVDERYVHYRTEPITSHTHDRPEPLAGTEVATPLA